MRSSGKSRRPPASSLPWPGPVSRGRVAMVVRGHAPSCASPTTVFSMVAAGSSLPMCRTSASGAWSCVPGSSPPLLGPGTRRGPGMAVLLRLPAFWGHGPCAWTTGAIPISANGKGMASARWTHTASCQPTPVLARVATVVIVVQRSLLPGGPLRPSGVTTTATCWSSTRRITLFVILTQ